MGNREEAADLLRRKAAEDLCPIAGGIALATGEAYPQSMKRTRVGDREEIRVVPEPPTHVLTLLGEGSLHWSAVSAYCGADSPSDGVRVEGGEGAMGDEGFLFVTRLEDGGVEWIARFYENPFDHAWISQGKVHALSTHDEFWTFDLVQPGAVTVEARRPEIRIRRCPHG